MSFLPLESQVVYLFYLFYFYFAFLWGNCVAFCCSVLSRPVFFFLFIYLWAVVLLLSLLLSCPSCSFFHFLFVFVPCFFSPFLREIPLRYVARASGSFPIFYSASVTVWAPIPTPDFRQRTTCLLYPNFPTKRYLMGSNFIFKNQPAPRSFSTVSARAWWQSLSSPSLRSTSRSRLTSSRFLTPISREKKSCKKGTGFRVFLARFVGNYLEFV